MQAVPARASEWPADTPIACLCHHGGRSQGVANFLRQQGFSTLANISGGINAWLVEDHSLPLIAMQFAMVGGSSQDPEDKPGVANFLTAMMDEGAGDMTAEAFQAAEEELAMKMSFDAGRDSFSGSFQTLTENRVKATDLLALALTRPRFDQDAIDRMRRQLQAGIAFDMKDPDKVANETWYRIAFPNHPYGRPTSGTIESVGKITAADLEGYRRRVFAKDNLLVSIVGRAARNRRGPNKTRPIPATPMPIAAASVTPFDAVFMLFHRNFSNFDHLWNWAHCP